MKKLLVILLTVVMLIGMIPMTALAADPAGTLETLSDVGVTGSKTFMYTASVLNTPNNTRTTMTPVLFVYPNTAPANQEEAYALLDSLGLIDVIEAERGAVLVATPTENSWGAQDVEVYNGLLKHIFYDGNGAKLTRFNMMYALGEGSGATFIHTRLSQNANRIAGIATFGGSGSMNPYADTAVALPAYIAGGTANVINYYKVVNQTDAQKSVNGKTVYFNQENDRMQVMVNLSNLTSFTKVSVMEAWDNLFRYTTRTAMRKGIDSVAYEEANDEVFTLMSRPSVEKLNLSLRVFNEDNTSTRYYEWVPNEVLAAGNTKKVPVVFVLHGGTDHEIYEAESNGWVDMAGKERFMIVAPSSNTATNNTQLVKDILDRYSFIDKSRVYITGFSAGSNCISGMFGAGNDETVELFAAAVPFSWFDGFTYTGSAKIPFMYHTMTLDTNTTNVPYAPDAVGNENGRFLTRDANFNMLKNMFNMHGIALPEGLVYKEENPANYKWSDSSTNTFWRFNEYPAGDTTELKTPYGFTGSSINFYNSAGANMIRLSYWRDMIHTHFSSNAEIAWDFMKKFSRDPESKKVYEYGLDTQTGEAVAGNFTEVEDLGVTGSKTYFYRASELYQPFWWNLTPVIFVYPDKNPANRKEALAAMNSLGLIELAEQEHALVIYTTALTDGNWTADAEKNRLVFKDIIDHIHYNASTPTNPLIPKITYMNLIYAIGNGSGANFINTTLSQYANRIAGVGLVNGTTKIMPNTKNPESVPLPAYIVNGTVEMREYYLAVNDAKTKVSNNYWYNGMNDRQQVFYNPAGVTSFDKTFVNKVWSEMFRWTTRGAIYARIADVPDGLNGGGYATDTVNVLMERPNVEKLDLHMEERLPANNNVDNRWFEWIPNEAIEDNNGYEEGRKYPLVIFTHGTGDHPIYTAEGIGWVSQAGKERFILASPQNNAGNAAAMSALDELIASIKARYPVDESRIYFGGFSGGTQTVYGAASTPEKAKRFAAIAPFTSRAGNWGSGSTAFTGNVDDVDLPFMYTTGNIDNNTSMIIDGKRVMQNSASGLAADINTAQIRSLTKAFQVNNITLPASWPNSLETFWRFDAKDLPAPAVQYYTKHGVEFKAYDFENDRGVPLVRLATSEGINHCHYTEYAELVWGFFKQYARDTETGAVVYNGVADIKVDGVSLNKTTVALKTGETLALMATVSPADATNQSVSWSSSNSKAAVVDANGLVTAKGVGTAIITVTTQEGGKTASCTVTVSASAVKISGNPANLTVGKTAALKADQAVTWSVTPSALASIGKNGVLSAKKPGVVTVTATMTNGTNATCKITVNAYVSMRMGKTTAIQNGIKTTIDNKGAKPFTISKRTMVPLRFIGEKMGGKVAYTTNSAPIYVKYEDVTVELKLGQTTMKVTQGKTTETVKLDVAAQLRGGRTYLPLRAISEALGFDVKYNADGDYIVVNNPKMTAALLSERMEEAKNVIK